MSRWEERQDPLTYKAFRSSSIHGRACVLYQWLNVLALVNEGYENLTDEIPTFEGMKRVVQEVNQHVQENASFVTDTQDLAAEAIQGDDVANVRTTTDESFIQHMQEEAGNKDSGDSDDILIVSCAVLDRTPDQSLEDARRSVVEGALQAFKPSDEEN